MRFHLEHRDGRKWTDEEIQALRFGEDEWVEGVGMDSHCCPILLNRFGRWDYPDSDIDGDMFVVFEKGLGL